MAKTGKTAPTEHTAKSGRRQIALRKQRWPWFYALLFIDTFNRESSALLICAFAVTMWREMSWKPYLAHIVALGIVFAAVKLFINHIFAHNPGFTLKDDGSLVLPF